MSKTFANRPKSQARLMRDQLTEFKEAFDMFDTNGTGTIDELEIKNLMKSIG